jgi:hypothetical protein
MILHLIFYAWEYFACLCMSYFWVRNQGWALHVGCGKYWLQAKIGGVDDNSCTIAKNVEVPLQSSDQRQMIGANKEIYFTWNLFNISCLQMGIKK